MVGLVDVPAVIEPIRAYASEAEAVAERLQVRITFSLLTVPGPAVKQEESSYASLLMRPRGRVHYHRIGAVQIRGIEDMDPTLGIRAEAHKKRNAGKNEKSKFCFHIALLEQKIERNEK